MRVHVYSVKTTFNAVYTVIDGAGRTGGSVVQRAATYDVSDSGSGARPPYGRAYTTDASPLDSAGFVELDMKRFGR